MSTTENFSLLLSSAYLPPVSYFSKIRNSSEVLFDYHEYFIKQTYRNRCYISTSNGVQALVIPVKHAGGNKMEVKNVRISYSEDWIKNHWRAIESSYNRSPYFEYYKDELHRIYAQRFEFLKDLNEVLTDWLAEAARLTLNKKHTEHYLEFPENGCMDLRNTFHPKSKTETRDQLAKPYTQVFSDRFSFIPELSMLDLLFCKGQDAIHFL